MPFQYPAARLSLPLLILSPFQTLSAGGRQRARPKQRCKMKTSSQRGLELRITLITPQRGNKPCRGFTGFTIKAKRTSQGSTLPETSKATVTARKHSLWATSKHQLHVYVYTYMCKYTLQSWKQIHAVLTPSFIHHRKKAQSNSPLLHLVSKEKKKKSKEAFYLIRF